MEKNRSQADKFKDLAREADCDEDEDAFDKKLKRITKPVENSADNVEESKNNKE